MKLQTISLRQILIISLIFVGIVSFASISLAQNQSVELEIKKNRDYLYRNAVVLNNGYIPFSQNGKWGIRKPNGEEFLAPIYDSLLNGDGARFITVKGSQYQLLDFDLWNWMDSLVVSIHCYNNTYTVVDNKGVTSKYNSYSRDRSDLSPSWDKVVSHLRYKPRNQENSIFKPNPIIRTIRYPENQSIIDSIQLIKNPQAQEEFVFFKDGKEYWRMMNVCKDYSIQGKNYFQYSTDELGSVVNHIFDLNTLSSLFSMKAGQLTYFEHEGKDYFLANRINGLDGFIRIFDTNGTLVLESKGAIKYDHGFLMENLKPLASNFPNNYNLHSFPDYKIVESNTIVFSFGHDENEPLLIRLPNNEDYTVYLDSKPIYRFKFPYQSVRLYSYAVLPKTKEELICLELTIKNGVGSYLLLSSKGTVITRSDNPIVCLYDEKFDQMKVQLSKQKKGVKFPVNYSGVYLPEKDQILITPFEISSWHQTDTNTILYADNYWNEKRQKSIKSYYFLDLEGNCVNEEVFSEAIFYTINNEKVMQLKQSGVIPAIYNSHLNKLCDSCYFYELNIKKDYNDNSYFVVNKDLTDVLVEVVDENLQRILPDQYLAVIDQGNYFAVLTKDHQIEYIPNPLK